MGGQRRKCRAVAVLSALLLVFAASREHPAAGAAAEAGGPRPPCGGDAPVPPYAEVDALPNVGAWSGDELGGDWRLPPCTGWSEADFQTLVALAARFRYEGGVDGLLERFGAISELEDVRYWSVSDDRWRDLVDEAHAVTGPGEDQRERRADFSAEEMRAGRALYFYQDDNRPAGGAVYRLEVLEAAPGRLVIAVTNVTEVSMLLVTLLEPGAVQSVYFFERLPDEAEGVWGHYSLTRTGEGASSLVAGHEKSYINRAAAIFRHIAGIPTDKEPPVAR